MKYLIFQVVIFIGLISLGSTVLAANSTFTMQTLVGDDTTPPSIPASVTAVPVATTQIDISWASSTDDFLLSGYYLYRDDVRIATTTGVSYSDSGLLQSTLYTYYVTAFDSSFNESSSSTIVATTTLSPAPPVATSTASSSTTIYGSISNPFEIIRLEIIPDKTSVIIRYDTRGHIRSIVRWGKGISYEIGSLAEQIFSTHHEIRITNLSPETRYFFSIDGEGNRGGSRLLTENSFVTLPSER